MKIVVCGTRGFPNIQGGVETHCEELYPRVAALGYEIVVVRRKGYVEKGSPLSCRGVAFKDTFAPRVVALESVWHTAIGVLCAKWEKADLLHIHAVGPSIVIPIAKLLGLRVVVTHHGPDYERKQWNFFARFFIKLGERMAARYANEIIAISPVICNILSNKYRRTKHVHLIYNGVNIPASIPDTSYINSLGLEANRYILAVGRFVEEKNFDHLVETYSTMEEARSYKLAIAGDSDIETAYSRELKAKAKEKGVVLAGMVKGEKLAGLYAHAALFVLPSSHEGLPITLLEAMSYRRKVVVSNIQANRAVGLEPYCYFESGDWDDFRTSMSRQLEASNKDAAYDLSKYNWDTIAASTAAVYDTLAR
ncbi:glycosyl transferase [Bacteroidia bacterium]|nr:glycosyl transferase [Bacteroidia bacterium]GHV49396.1 glycosyl transferase [Bacteroidia bacterium]